MRALALASALTALGCGAGPIGDDAGAIDAGAPRVELGTGTSGFVPIADGAELELVAGPQGGYHVDLTARIWNLDLDRLRIAYEARPGEGAPVSVPTEVELTPLRVVREGDHWLRAGDFLQLDVEAPADLVGATLCFHVRARDAAGRTAEDTRRATVVDRD